MLLVWFVVELAFNANLLRAPPMRLKLLLLLPLLVCACVYVCAWACMCVCLRVRVSVSAVAAPAVPCNTIASVTAQSLIFQAKLASKGNWQTKQALPARQMNDQADGSLWENAGKQSKSTMIVFVAIVVVVDVVVVANSTAAAAIVLVTAHCFRSTIILCWATFSTCVCEFLFAS